MNTNGKLRDIIAPNLLVLFTGFNPGLRSAELGHHYAGPNNRFWRLLFESGLTPRLLPASEDHLLLSWSLGLTNIVARPTRLAAELTSAELNSGGEVLRQKFEHYRPQVACYVGIGIYKALTKCRQCLPGRQAQSVVDGVIDFVVPSPSGLNRIPYADQLASWRELADLVSDLRTELLSRNNYQKN
ncbi:MAG TPA: mismatch-specific DNA-glycosylase [Firmicutes bacterium]|nr:mismatch-specific DNA-glycosylase [Bacillota bacterium]